MISISNITIQLHQHPGLELKRNEEQNVKFYTHGEGPYLVESAFYAFTFKNLLRHYGEQSYKQININTVSRHEFGR